MLILSHPPYLPVAVVGAACSAHAGPYPLLGFLLAAAELAWFLTSPGHARRGVARAGEIVILVLAPKRGAALTGDVQVRRPRPGRRTMNSDTRTLAVPPLQVEWKDKPGQRTMVFALLAVVVVLDQAMKWWAWRHSPTAIINDGGDALVGAKVSEWYADPTTGALLDLLDFGLLGAAVSILIRRPRPLKVLVPGSLMIGGWCSNLLDRLGMHYWTAPDSVRGAVDFIHIGHHYYNVADFFIIGATPLFSLGVGYLGRRARNRPGTTGSVASATTRQPRRRTWTPVFAGVLGLLVVVGLGATNYGELTAPSASAGAETHH
jgi:lipoprotein signal peptidase